MRIADPCDWVIERLRNRVPFFAVRFNDGEMQMMYRTVPEGKVLGTDANPCPVRYALGNDLREMLDDMNRFTYDNVLIGHSGDTDRADEESRRFWMDCRERALDKDYHFANEHWPLDGVVDGSTVRMLEEMRERDVMYVSCDATKRVHRLFKTPMVVVRSDDSWKDRHQVYHGLKDIADKGVTFVWAAGCGLKPTAWRLWREFPQSSHVDVGHLFNGACGLRDYGWLQRGDGPWYKPYFEDFVPWFEGRTK